MKNPGPGTVLAVDNGFYQHVGIVTDRTMNGRPMVISNSWRKGGVYEEPWDDFSCQQHVTVQGYPGQLDADEVLRRARAKTGTRWNLLLWNCEHFVHWAHGLRPRSPQVTALTACVSILAGVTLIYRLSGNTK